MATWANGHLRLDFGPADGLAGWDAALTRYRCPCRDCAFSQEEDRGEGAPIQPARHAGSRILSFERRPGETFA